MLATLRPTFQRVTASLATGTTRPSSTKEVGQDSGRPLGGGLEHVSSRLLDGPTTLRVPTLLGAGSPASLRKHEVDAPIEPASVTHVVRHRPGSTSDLW